MGGKIRKIALTGGPCAGKTALLESLKAEFGDDVLIVPEAATQLLAVPYEEGGIGIPGRDVEWSQEWQDRFQKMIIEKQLQDETFYTQLADGRERPTVVVCDRGVLDGAAYTTGGREEFVQKFNLQLETCFQLYDEVIHLNSLATDKPDLYEELKSTNPTRFEDAERARELDEKLFAAYEGHPNHLRIQSGEGIEHKIETCFTEIRKLLREPQEDKETQSELKPPVI